jgi:hypothetical protein
MIRRLVLCGLARVHLINDGLTGGLPYNKAEMEIYAGDEAVVNRAKV